MIISLSTLTATLADKLRPLSGASTEAILELTTQELRVLASKLRVRGARTPLGQAVTLHGWTSEGKIVQAILNKFIRHPQRGRGVAVEERAWHGVTWMPPEGDLAAALESLCARGGGVVNRVGGDAPSRLICFDLSMTLARVEVHLDWAKNLDQQDDWFKHVHGFSSLEVWWWRYFESPQVRPRVVSMRDVDIVLF